MSLFIKLRAALFGTWLLVSHTGLRLNVSQDFKLVDVQGLSLGLRANETSEPLAFRGHIYKLFHFGVDRRFLLRRLFVKQKLAERKTLESPFERVAVLELESRGRLELLDKHLYSFAVVLAYCATLAGGFNLIASVKHRIL